MMNDEEAKCAAIVFSGFCIGSLVSWVSSFYWWTNFKRHRWDGYPLIAMLTCIVFSWPDNKCPLSFFMLTCRNVFCML
jgi:hypothetical protein